MTGQPHPGQHLPPPGDPAEPYVQYTASPGHTAVVVQQIEQPNPSPSMVGAIAFSCVVTWLCCWPLGLIAFIVASKLIEDEMHFIFSCPQHEDLRESRIQAVGKAENVTTENTVLLHFLTNSKTRCIATLIYSALTWRFDCRVTHMCILGSRVYL